MSTSNTTVMQVLPSLISGGVERGAIEIAEALSANKCRSIILSNGGKLVKNIDQQTKHLTLNVASKSPFNIWGNIDKISKIIQEERVNIIHARSRAPAWSCYFACKKMNVKFVTTVHGIYKVPNLLKKIYNNIMTRGDRVIAVSNFVKEYIVENYKIDSAKIRIIPRGVDSSFFDESKINQDKLEICIQKYNIPKGLPIILLPGRFSKWKGHSLLVKAIDKIRNLDFVCIMVGDILKHQSYVLELRNLIMKLKLQAKIQIFESEQNMPELYSLSSIVLSTSKEPEAFGRTIIEAQSMKKLVIASNIGGAKETIQDGVTGFLFDQSDIDDLAAKISYAISMLNTKKYIQICNNARESIVQSFSLKVMQDKTISVYKELA